MIDLIIAIILSLFGIIFTIWGIYQVKTGKMVAKRAKNPVDEPRQVGLLFIMVGIAAFWLTAIFGVNAIGVADDNVVKIVTWILALGLILSVLFFILCVVAYGLRHKRIFGLKNLPKIAKYTKEYYKIINLALFVCPIASLVLFLGGENMPWSVVIIIVLIIAIAIITAISLMVKIERKFKK